MKGHADCACQVAPGEICRSCCSQIRNLAVSLNGRAILRDIHLHFHCGEITAIIGPNGGGKSTLLKAMVGELPYTGEIVFHRHDGRGTRPRIGYVPQKVQTDPADPMTVRDLFQTLLSPKPIWFLSDKRLTGEMEHALSHMEAVPLLDRRVGALSGGELQRVLVALALAPTPDLLLLDEPMAGIDPSGMGLFYRMVSRLRHEHDLSIIMVSHDLALSARFADTLVLLKESVIVHGRPDTVIRHPQTRILMGIAVESVEKEEPAADHHGGIRHD